MVAGAGVATAATAGKLGAQIMAGQKLGKFFDIISGTAGKLATKGTQAGLGKITDTFYKGVAQENLPMVLRSSATSSYLIRSFFIFVIFLFGKSDLLIATMIGTLAALA